MHLWGKIKYRYILILRNGNLFIWLGLNVALTHQKRSYRDRETTEYVEAQKRKQRLGNDRKRTATTKNITKRGKKHLIFVWSLAYNLSDLSGPTRNMKVQADLACQIIETHKPPTPYRDKVLTTGESPKWQA